MRFVIHEDIFEMFPDLLLGLLVARGIDNSGGETEIIQEIQKLQTKIRDEYILGTLSQEPRIQAWRNAYSAFGSKPKKYQSSVESLYRMALKGLELRHINKVVDIYNAISLKHMIPVGGDDLDKVEGDITLRLAAGDEEFVPLNSDVSERVKPGEVIYADSKDVLCRRWNWRECDKTKMGTGTKDVVLVVEGLPPVGRAEMRLVIEELSELVKKFCSGEVRVQILDKINCQLEI
jgi:DNA/RNA-binding domain of Phe-tRNA-synthetase-like protein